MIDSIDTASSSPDSQIGCSPRPPDDLGRGARRPVHLIELHEAARYGNRQARHSRGCRQVERRQRPLGRPDENRRQQRRNRARGDVGGVQVGTIFQAGRKFIATFSVIIDVACICAWTIGKFSSNFCKYAGSSFPASIAANPSL
jgi:hypothetical protein